MAAACEPKVISDDAEQAGAAGADGLLLLFGSKVDDFRDRTALSLYENGRWRKLTYAGLASSSRRLASLLLEQGAHPGDRVAILSESCPEWAVAFFGSFLAGAVVVPLDSKLGLGELEAVVRDCRPRVLFASSQMLGQARQLKQRVDPAIGLFLLDGEGDEEVPAFSRLKAMNRGRGFPSRSPADTALIVYTSGTSGKPKGVMIRVSNLLFQVRGLEHVVHVTEESVFLSILPLNHLLEFTCGFLGVLHAGGTICYYHSLYPQDLVQAMREKKVTSMITVPLFLRMLKDGIEREARAQGRGFALRLALALGRRLPPSWKRRFLFRRAHESLGGCLREFICGGAPLDPEVERFFDALGISVYQGYGLTETSPVVSVNTRLAHKAGTVGRSLPGVEVKLRQGEILTRGPHVMSGYYNRDDLTRAAIDPEGWFATGDLGEMDEGGFLRITGRAKNLIVLPGGKKVQPEEVEEFLSTLAEVGEICVFGRICPDGPNRGNEEVTAVAVPSEALRLKFRNGGLEGALRNAVEEKCAELAPFKRPSRIFMFPEALPKTSSRKVKRGEVAARLNER